MPNWKLHFVRFSFGVTIVSVSFVPIATIAVTFNEFKVPTSGGSLRDIVSGPDGNLWFTEYYGNKVGRITPAGIVTEFPIPTPGSRPMGIATGSDGNIWFTESEGNKIGRITPEGVITEFLLPSAGEPTGITSGPDGNLWFTEFSGNKIGRITPTGVVTEFPIPPHAQGSAPNSITCGPDGNLWFTVLNADMIGKITVSGDITEFAVPTRFTSLRSITTGPDSNLWFTEGTAMKIGRISPAGIVSEFPIPFVTSDPFVIAAGPDGNLWFTQGNSDKIGMMTPKGVFWELTLPSVGGFPHGITSGPDGNLWLTEPGTDKIGQLVVSSLPPPPAPKLDGFDFSTRAVAFPVGEDPAAVAIGDLNGDGRNDVVIVTRWSHEGLFVFLQSESGRLNPPKRYKLSGPTISVDTGDLNQDGKPDVVLGSSGMGIEVFLNAGSGILAPSIMYLTANSHIVKVADMNGDGRPDVVGLGPSGISILFQNDQGALNFPVEFPADACGGVLELKLAVGDLNNDGLADVVTQCFDGHARRLAVLFQKQDGILSSPLFLEAAEIFLFTIGDINGDGLNELVAGGGVNLFVYHQNNQGGLEPPIVSSIMEGGGSGVLAGPIVADVNKDGRNDVVFVALMKYDATGLLILRQNASGGLLAPDFYPNGYVFPVTYIHGVTLAVGDVNGDGHPDAVYPSSEEGLVVVYHTPPAPAIYASPFPVSFGNGASVSQIVNVANFGSTMLEIGSIVLGGEGHEQFQIADDTCSNQSLAPYTYCPLNVTFTPVSVDAKKGHLLIPSNDPLRAGLKVPLYGNAPFHDLFWPYTIPSPKITDFPEAVAIGDLNGDGKNDVALVSSGYADPVLVYLQDSSGRLLPPVSYMASGGRTIEIGDVTGDGRPDLVTNKQVFAQNASGTFDSMGGYPVGSYSIATGDFNGDGLLDVAGIGWGFNGSFVDYTTADLFLQGSNGTLGPPISSYVPYAGFNQVTAGEVNGDNRTDIVVMSGQGYVPEISVLSQKADGSFQLHYYIADYGNTWGVAVGDVNGDNRNDIVFTYRYIPKIGMLLQNPDGTFGPEISYDSHPVPEAVYIADVNGDGLQDIIVVHGDPSPPLGPAPLGVFLQEANGMFMPEEIYGLPYATHTNPHGLKVGDINGDGMADVVIANYNYGPVVLYGKVPSPSLQLLSPNGGERLASGASYAITWTRGMQSRQIVDVALYYSIDQGNTWTLIGESLYNDTYLWEVPWLQQNSNECLVRVVGYDSSRNVIAEDTSDESFSIQGVKVTSPVSGTILKGGNPYTVVWETHSRSPVAKTQLFYSLNGGTSWRSIGRSSGDPRSFYWKRVRKVRKPNSKSMIKVVLKDARRNTIASGLSDAFTIE